MKLKEKMMMIVMRLVLYTEVNMINVESEMTSFAPEKSLTYDIVKNGTEKETIKEFKKIYSKITI